MEARPSGTQRALALLPFLVTGALSLSIFREMRRRGFDITVAFYQHGGGYTADPAEDFASAGRLLDMSQHYGQDALATLERTLDERHIDLILQVGAPRAYRQLPYLKQRRRRLRILDTLYNKVGHTLDHFLYERCFDGVIVESEDMRRFVLDNSVKADPSVFVVESGIDLDLFVPPPCAPQTGGKGLVVGYLGRMSAEKNPLGFVELAEKLHAALPMLSFRMFGEGPLAEGVRARIAGSSAAGALCYEGYADSTKTALSRLDVLVVPSKVDGRPNVVMEANACGVPVFGAPVGGIPEMIEPGRNGFLMGPEQHGGIVEVLRRWLSDPVSFAAMRSSSRTVAEARFDRRRMLDTYEAVFRGFPLPRSRGPSVISGAIGATA